MACMTDKGEAKVCPHCGFDNGQENGAPFLPMGTVLQERYLVGKAQSSNSEGVTYCAYDITLKSKVMLREFFPQSMAARETDGATIRVPEEQRSSFRNCLVEFLSYSRGLARFRDLSGVLPVYDIFEDNGTAYSVTEFYDGGMTLRQFIEKNGGPVTWNAVRPLFMPLLSSLSALHEAGMGHYGLSPDHLLILPDGRMKMIHCSIPSVRKSGGVLPEMLPEGCAALEQYSREGRLTEATDVYAFAACVFFALTRREPQSAPRRKTDARLLIPTSILQQIPKHVVGALANGLQVFPDKRTPTFERMRAELSAAPVVAAEAEQREAEEPEPPAPKKKNGLPNFVVGLISFAAALLVFSLAGWAYLAATSHNDEPAESSSQVSSGDVSSEDVSSGEEDASSGEDSSSSGTSSYQLQGETVIVPKLVGQSLEQTQNNDSITVLVQERQFNDDVAEGIIISQSVEEGREIVKGGAVSVVVSKGSRLRTMPPVKNRDVNDVKADLLNAGFQIGDVTYEKTDSQEEGTVIRFADSTYTEGKQYEYGSRISLVVAEGE